MSPHVRIHQARQTLAGSIVVGAPVAPSDTLVADPSGSTNTISGINAPELTVTAPSSSTTPTQTPTNIPASSSKSSSHTSTGAIVGIVVGIFVAVAAVMITLMTIKHRKQMARRKQQMREARAAAAAKKGTTGGSGDAMQMHEKSAERRGAGVDIAYPPAPPAAMRESSHDGDSSFLSLKSTNSLQRIPPITPQSNNPFLPYLPSQTLAALGESSSSPSSHSPTAAAAPYAESRPQQSAAHAPAPSADENHAIPNPFGSPPHSRSPSQSTHNHSPSLDMDQLASFPAVQFANQNVSISPENPTFSISEYTDDADSISYSPPTAKESKATVKQAKARELKAMQDLISALDAPSAQSSAPSSWIDPTSGTGPQGKSRLSMGEGLVTPVEESSGSTLVANDPNSVAAPLPPAELFRAALALDKGKGKDKTNPFAG